MPLHPDRMPARIAPRPSRRRVLAFACASAAWLLGSAGARADGYPVRPIRIMVPNGAGGSIDLVARAIADRIETDLGQPVIVENRAGASGAIGAEIVFNAAPDGYYLLASSTSTNNIVPHVQKSARYDGVRGFEPIVNIAYTTKMVVVHPSLRVSTLRELIDYARARPGELNYSSTGVGSSTQLDAEMFSALAGITMVNVPYRTPGQQNAAVVANEVQVCLGSITQLQGSVQSGRLRALAVIARQRSPLLPDVPTVAEAGMPDLDIRTWIGLSAPAGTRPDVINVLNRVVNKALADPALRAWLAGQGMEPVGGSAAEFRATIVADDLKWKREIDRLGIRE